MIKEVTSYRFSLAWYNETIVAALAISVNSRRLRQYSRAVDASRPLVELSQHPTAPRVTIVSAIDTLFFSPPEIPCTNYISQHHWGLTSFPTRVLTVCFIPKMVSRILRNILRYWRRVICSGNCVGVLAFSAKAKVCLTVNVA